VGELKNESVFGWKLGMYFVAGSFALAVYVILFRNRLPMPLTFGATIGILNGAVSLIENQSGKAVFGFVITSPVFYALYRALFGFAFVCALWFVARLFFSDL